MFILKESNDNNFTQSPDLKVKEYLWRELKIRMLDEQL